MIGLGQTLKGRYRLEEEIGGGGMGVVYRALDLDGLPDRTYFAVKVIRAEYAADARYRERFEREFLAVRRIRSGHVISVFDRGTLDSELFIVMEHVAAPNLARVVADYGPLDSALAVQLIAQVGAALTAAHRAGVIHRDVKPSNVMVEDVFGKPHVYLGDFGIAKPLADSPTLTVTGEGVGTAGYTAPEQWRGQASESSDVFSLGQTLYFALTGSDPDPFVPTRELLKQRPLPPRRLRKVIARATALQPSARYVSVESLVEAAVGTRLILRPEQRSVRRPRRAARVATVPGGPPLARPAADSRMGEGPLAWRAGQAPKRLSGRDRHLSSRALFMATLVLVVLPAGFFAARFASDEQTNFPNSTSSEAIGLSFPDSWQRVNKAPRIPGVEFNHRLILASKAPGRRVWAVAGLVKAAGTALLPAPFLRRLDRQVRPDAVRLAEVAAYRYSGLRPELGRRLILFAVPTTRGIATVACVGDGLGAELSTCEGIAQTLKLLGSKPYPLGRDQGYAETLKQTFQKLKSARRDRRGRLVQATTRAGQADAARALASAYKAAAGVLTRTSVSSAAQGANRALTAALMDTRAAYGKLAAAAGRNDARAYKKARSAIRRAEETVERRLRALESLSYPIG